VKWGVKYERGSWKPANTQPVYESRGRGVWCRKAPDRNFLAGNKQVFAGISISGVDGVLCGSIASLKDGSGMMGECNAARWSSMNAIRKIFAFALIALGAYFVLCLTLLPPIHAHPKPKNINDSYALCGIIGALSIFGGLWLLRKRKAG
jgi:hypothetical protein